MRFVLVIGFIGLLHIAAASENNSSLIYNSLCHALSVFSDLWIYVFIILLVIASNAGPSPSPGFPECVRASTTALFR
jgi:hypothetical protein